MRLVPFLLPLGRVVIKSASVLWRVFCQDWLPNTCNQHMGVG